MVERKDVEALLSYVEMRLDSNRVELPPVVADDTLADLCRAWLALESTLAKVDHYKRRAEAEIEALRVDVEAWKASHPC